MMHRLDDSRHCRASEGRHVLQGTAASQASAAEGLQVDFLYEPMLQAAELAPDAAWGQSHRTSLTAVDEVTQTAWALGRPMQSAKPGQMAAGPDVTVSVQQDQGLPHAAALRAVQLLQTFSAGAQARRLQPARQCSAQQHAAGPALPRADPEGRQEL